MTYVPKPKLGIPIYRRLRADLENQEQTARRFETLYDIFKKTSPELRELSGIIEKETGIRMNRLDIALSYNPETPKGLVEKIISREMPRLERKFNERQAGKTSQ